MHPALTRLRQAVALVILLVSSSARLTFAQSSPPPLVVEHGVFVVHLLLHAIGTEEYTLTRTAGGLHLTEAIDTSDRGMRRTASTELELGPNLNPIRLHQSSLAAGTEAVAETTIADGTATIAEPAGSRTIPLPPRAFPAAGGMPAALEMMMMRYWLAHGRPVRLPVLRGSDQALPIEIRPVGNEAFTSHGRLIRLTRYTVANLIFGREVLWMNDRGRLAAVMTFAGGLPQEVVLDQYEEAAGELFHSGVRQEMLDLADLRRQLRLRKGFEAGGTYALTGVRLIDGRGGVPVERATVLVRQGKIAAAGTTVNIPHGMRVIREDGRSLLPGLWEMHSHFSGVEFGPALLSAGITTARDCGGEREFLLTARRELVKDGLGPRLLLAGLIDSGGPLAFGAVDVQSPEQGAAAVDAYADAGFEQIKVYTQLQPEVLKAIAAEAHRLGLTVTGHVPAAVSTPEAIADGMDQINHLQFITRDFTDGAKTGFNSTTTRAQETLAALVKNRVVVDPTAGWGEMASHPRTTDARTFEPGLDAAPWTLAYRFQTMGSSGPAAASFADRMHLNLQVIDALHRAGVPIVAGSDTNLLGFGLNRELELYVQAGMTPLEALQTATLIPARVMRHEADSGTIEAGKRADMVLVDGDPSVKISDLRHVVSVITEGRMYSARALAATIGFRR